MKKEIGYKRAYYYFLYLLCVKSNIEIENEKLKEQIKYLKNNATITY